MCGMVVIPDVEPSNALNGQTAEWLLTDVHRRFRKSCIREKKIQFSWSTGALGQVWMDSMPITLRIIQQIKAGEYQSDFLDMG